MRPKQQKTNGSALEAITIDDTIENEMSKIKKKEMLQQLENSSETILQTQLEQEDTVARAKKFILKVKVS